MPTTPKIKAPGTRTPKAPSVEPKATTRPPISDIRRTPKPEKLQVRIERFYKMIGTMLVPMGRFVPQFNPVGNGFKEYAKEASEAWVDLAEEDPKVKKYLESITGASTWGNVLGVHFMIIMGVLPDTAQQVGRVVVDPDAIVDDPIAFAMNMGMSKEDAEKAVKMAEGIVSDRPPEPKVENIQTKEHENNEQMIRDIKAGMATPEQMGVRNDGQAWSGPMNTGGYKQ